MAEVAAAAGVALDTVYAVVGPKSALFRLLVETAVSGTDVPVPAEERDYVGAIHVEADAGRKLAVYARAMRQIARRMVPLLCVLQAAAPADPELAAVWREISERRAGNTRVLAAELAATSRLREGLSVRPPT